MSATRTVTIICDGRTPCDPYDLADWERRECPECRGTRCGCPDCEGHGYLPCGEVA